jgi:hypothetical protein
MKKENIEDCLVLLEKKKAMNDRVRKKIDKALQIYSLTHIKYLSEYN